MKIVTDIPHPIQDKNDLNYTQRIMYFGDYP